MLSSCGYDMLTGLSLEGAAPMPQCNGRLLSHHNSFHELQVEYVVSIFIGTSIINIAVDTQHIPLLSTWSRMS